MNNLFHDLDYINEVLNETNEDLEHAHNSHGDDGDDGLTFTAKASRKLPFYFLLFFVTNKKLNYYQFGVIRFVLLFFGFLF